MASNWQELTNLSGSRELVVERVRIRDTDIAIEGRFDLPPLARLPYEDQVFVATFVRAHGSIKDMESAFGVSYPTIKNRLARLSQALDFVRVTQVSSREETLARLERGEITASEAIERLNA